MRNPGRWRTIALATAGIGTLAAGVAFLFPEAALSEGLRFILAAIGLDAMLFGAATALWAHRDVRARVRLTDDAAVIARWHVDAATWRRFLDADVATREDGSWRPNVLAMAGEVPAGGVDVVVGADAILIADSVHALPRHGTPEVLSAELVEGRQCPDTIALRLRHPARPLPSGGLAGPSEERLEFPVAPGAWREARKVVAFYAQGRPGQASFFHGRGDGSDPEDESVCDHCGLRTHRFRSVCPRCGGGLVSRRWLRRLGGILLVLGAGLGGGLAWLLWYLTPLLRHPGVDIDGEHFDGTRMQALAIWAILGAMLAFGVAAFGQGAWQVATGRRARYVPSFLLAIAGGLYLVALWI